MVHFSTVLYSAAALPVVVLMTVSRWPFSVGRLSRAALDEKCRPGQCQPQGLQPTWAGLKFRIRHHHILAQLKPGQWFPLCRARPSLSWNILESVLKRSRVKFSHSFPFCPALRCILRFCWWWQTIWLKRGETLSSAAGWNVPLCLGTFAGFSIIVAVHTRITEVSEVRGG